MLIFLAACKRPENHVEALRYTPSVGLSGSFGDYRPKERRYGWHDHRLITSRFILAFSRLNRG
jgi:hypothetical protein